MAVKHVIMDTDGVVLKPDKTVAPLQEDLSPHYGNFAEVAGFFSRYPGLGVSKCTSRSLASARQIAERTGVNSLSAFEAGAVLYDPANKGVTRWTQAYPYLEAVSDVLLAFRDELFRQSTIERLSADFGYELRPLGDREETVTVEIPPGADKDHNGQKLHTLLVDRYMPFSMRELITRSLLRAFPSRSAVDYSLVGKGESTRHILHACNVRGEEALGIGDSDHTDRAMMGECGYVACPENADQALKEYVSRRSNGYVARCSYAAGMMEILRHAERHWF